MECRGMDAALSSPSSVAVHPGKMADQDAVKDAIIHGGSSSTSSGTSALASGSFLSSREILSNSERSSLTDSILTLETKTAAAKTPAGAQQRDKEEAESDVFSDALDTLSIAGSCSMNCSTSENSGEIPATESSHSLPRSSEIREFILDRFLPAAQELVSDSNSSCRKTWNLVRKQGLELASPPISSRNFGINQRRALSKIGADDCDFDAQKLIRGGCGILPKLCSGNSFRIFNAIPNAKQSARSRTIVVTSNPKPEVEEEGDGGRTKKKSFPAPETLASILSRPESESDSEFAESEDDIADNDGILNPPALEPREPSSSSAAAEDLRAFLLPPTDSWLCRTLPVGKI